MNNDKTVEVLAEHYRDSFDLVRSREKQRDRLFLIVIALLGFTTLQLQYVGLSSVLGVSAGGANVDFGKLPGPVVLSTTWTFLVTIILRYCQVNNHIEKQYHYLHKLERKLSELLGETDIFSREGVAYFANRDELFRHWVWGFYTVFIPLLIIVSVSLSGYLEFKHSAIPSYHKLFDLIIAVTVIFVISLYRGSEIVCSVKERFDKSKEESNF